MSKVKIQFYQKHVYGLPKNYIKDPEIAKAFFNLTGRITMTEADMGILKTFGCEFEQVLN